MNNYKVKPASSTRSAMLKMEQQISDNLSSLSKHQKQFLQNLDWKEVGNRITLEDYQAIMQIINTL